MPALPPLSGILEQLHEAIDAGSYDSAIALARSALARKARLDVSLLLGRALMYAGRAAEARAVLEEVVGKATRSENPTVVASALDLLWWIAWSNLDGTRTREIADRILTLKVPATSPEAFRVHVLKATQLIQLGDAAAAEKIVDEAEHQSRDADIDSFARYLCVKADLLSALGRPAEALSYTRLAADIGARRDDHFLHWLCLTYYSYSLGANGHYPEAYDAYVATESAAKGASLTWEVVLSRARAAWVALQIGRANLAHGLISSCFDAPYTQGWMTATRALVGIFVGLTCGDEELLARAADTKHLDAALSSSDYYTIGPIVAAFVAYYLHLARKADATALIELAVPLLQSPDCGWVLFPFVATYGSDAALRRSQELMAKYSPEHRVAEAHRRHFAALLAARNGNRVRSEMLAGEAQLLYEDFGCALSAARCLEVAGRLAEAFRRYDTMGAAGEAQRIRHVRGQRGRPRRSYEASRERREILRLLLSGLTSSTIADRLGVSERTIKSRVSEIYDFEGVRSRSELLALHKRSHAAF